MDKDNASSESSDDMLSLLGLQLLKVLSCLTSRLEDTLSNVKSFTRCERMSGTRRIASWFLSVVVHAGSSDLDSCCTQISKLRSSGSIITISRTRQNEASCLKEKLQTRLVKFGTSCTCHRSFRIAIISSARLTAHSIFQKTTSQATVGLGS